MYKALIRTTIMEFEQYIEEIRQKILEYSNT